jgi:hypothetical protein
VVCGTALRQVSGSSRGQVGGQDRLLGIGLSRRVSVVGLHLPPSPAGGVLPRGALPDHLQCAHGGQSEGAVGDLSTCERPILPNSAYCLTASLCTDRNVYLRLTADPRSLVEPGDSPGNALTGNAEQVADSGRMPMSGFMLAAARRSSLLGGLCRTSAR